MIGKEDFVSPQGARTQGCIRLTALPESSRAGNGRPLILTSAPGAPTGRSRCIIQPANHVRPGGVRPSVGMGSSLCVGAPVALLVAGCPPAHVTPGPPSGERAVFAPQHPGFGQHPPAPRLRRVQQRWRGSASRSLGGGSLGEHGGVGQ